MLIGVDHDAEEGLDVGQVRESFKINSQNVFWKRF